jgi:hypothetical protein
MTELNDMLTKHAPSDSKLIDCRLIDSKLIDSRLSSSMPSNSMIPTP